MPGARTGRRACGWRGEVRQRGHPGERMHWVRAGQKAQVRTGSGEGCPGEARCRATRSGEEGASWG